MYTIIKTTPQNFLKKIAEFGVRSSIKSFSPEQKDLMLNFLPFFYSYFIKNVAQLQMLQATLVKEYSNERITVFLTRDSFIYRIFLEKRERATYHDNFHPYWDIRYWRLCVFVEKSEKEKIWLYMPRFMIIPSIENMNLPENVDLKVVIDWLRSNLSYVVDQMLKYTNYAKNNNVKVVTVKIPALIVDYLKNEKEVTAETLKDMLLQLKNKYNEQIVSFLRKNTEKFMETIASYYFGVVKNEKIYLPVSPKDDKNFLENFLHAKNKKIKDIVTDDFLYVIVREMKNKIERMSLEELKRYNDRKVIYNTLFEIYNNIDITTDVINDIKYHLSTFIYEKYNVKDQIDDIVAFIKNDIENYFGKQVDNFLKYKHLHKIFSSSSLKNDPFIQEILEKIENTKITEDLYCLLSDKVAKTEPDLYSFLEKWQIISFSDIYRDFLESFGGDYFVGSVYLRVSSRFYSFVKTEIQKIAEEVVPVVLEKVRQYVKDALDYYMVDEIKKLIEERLREYEDDEK